MQTGWWRTVILGAAVGVLALAPLIGGRSAQQDQPMDLAGLLARSAEAAADGSTFYLKVDGIEGDATASGHAGEIEIESFSWGATQSGTGAAGGGAGAGKVSFQDLHVTTTVSKASPALLLSVATGKHIKNAVLVAEKGAKPVKYLEIKLEDVLISSYQTGGSGGSTPSDQVSLNFAKVEFSYFPQSDKGTTGSPATACFSVKDSARC